MWEGNVKMGLKYVNSINLARVETNDRPFGTKYSFFCFRKM